MQPRVPRVLLIALAGLGACSPSRQATPAKPAPPTDDPPSSAPEVVEPEPASRQAPGLEITPGDPWVLAGRVGGPFEPSTRSYVLRNGSDAALPWRVSSDRPGVSWSPRAGTLAPGEEVEVTAALDAALVRSRGPGTHTNAAVFTAGGRTVRVLAIRLTIEAPEGGADLGQVSSLTRFGITWVFAGEHQAGTYVNGDPWILGPVRVIEISPPSLRRGRRVLNGSMLNPSPATGQPQGYDSSMYGKYRDDRSYSDALNVALGVSSEAPLELPPGSSLVSSISLPDPGARPQLRTAAVLTVVAERPAADAFRPPYCGTDKTSKHRASQLRPSILARLEPVPSTPPLERVERMFERPWIDHVPMWFGPAFCHPRDNLPNYGRELVEQVGYASLMLNLDFTDEEKRTLLIRFVQVGIDFHGILTRGGRNNWQAGAGFNHGRKWTILFSGMLLDDPDMSGVGLDPTLLFQGEDGQTFYVEETSPGVYNAGNGGYGPQHVGMPEWGIKHTTVPTDDDVSWQARYRECCTANAWWGEVLAARIVPGARELWNHEALFDYQDRYYETTSKNGSPDWIVSWSAFPIDMWRRYRSRY